MPLNLVTKKAIKYKLKALLKFTRIYPIYLLFLKFKEKINKVFGLIIGYCIYLLKFSPDVPFSPHSQYYRWLLRHHPRKADLEQMAETIPFLKYDPLISVIMPVYNSPLSYLEAAIESVINQIYPNWELCIADDASTNPEIRPVLEKYAQQDSRIKTVYRTTNGHISACSNSAIEIATGEFLALLDHDDLLTSDALYQVALELNKYPDADMIYSDEDKIDERGWRKEPFFKPDWCPDSFLSRMYTCHLGIYRKKLVEAIDGFRIGFEGSQDYDLVLRLTEKTDKIYHISKILYHWRIHQNSTAKSIATKNYAVNIAQQALAESLERRGESGDIVPIIGDHHIIRYRIKEYKLASIIIPTKNLGDTLNRCLSSIFIKTNYPSFEIILVDNQTTEEKAHEIINYWKKTEPNRLKVFNYDLPFNFSEINNYAVKFAQGDYLLFLNNDTEVINDDWLTAMVEQSQRPQIGAVGALLLFPDDTIQHAGVIAGLGGVAGHSHKHFNAGHHGYFKQIQTINNYLAVTGACLMCRKEVFQEVNGFEEYLSVAYNDVDFCFKLIDKGYRNIYLPHVKLYHYESKSRGFDDTIEKQKRFNQEIEFMMVRWGGYIANDPCYSPHLSKKYENFSVN